MSAWFLPTRMEEHEGGSCTSDMGPEMGSDGRVTGWDPPRRIAYEGGLGRPHGQGPEALSPLTSEFLVEAQSGGTCVVRVTSSGFGTGAAWESEFWDDLEPNWRPFFDNLRLYLARFPARRPRSSGHRLHPGDADAVWSALHRARAGRGGLRSRCVAPPARSSASASARRCSGSPTRVPGMLSAFAFRHG